MRKVYGVIFSLILLFSLLIYGCSNDNDDDADAVEEDESKITIGATPWTSTEFPSEVAKSILEDMGYEVEIKEGELGVIFTALAEDDIDMFLDYWDPQFEEYLDKYSDSVEKVSTSYDNAERGLAVPTYMTEVDDVKDLKGVEDEVDNEILAIEESDPAIEAIPELIDSYDLDMEMINSTEPAMLSAVQDKIENQEPVVFFGWRPHSMFEMLDVKLLTNEDEPDLNTPSTVYTVANKNLEENNSDIYHFLKNWDMSLEEVEEMIIRVENNEESPKDLAEEWIEENQDRVEDMKEVD